MSIQGVISEEQQALIAEQSKFGSAVSHFKDRIIALEDHEIEALKEHIDTFLTDLEFGKSKGGK